LRGNDVVSLKKYKRRGKRHPEERSDEGPFRLPRRSGLSLASGVIPAKTGIVPARTDELRDCQLSVVDILCNFKT
jgi:hypothetical protein